MPVRDEVRRTQRTLAALDAAHLRAAARLDQERTRRDEVLAEADLVVAAQEGIEAAVLDIATGVGVKLTAQMLDVEIVEVRRIAKAVQRSLMAMAPAARRGQVMSGRELLHYDEVPSALASRQPTIASSHGGRVGSGLIAARSITLVAPGAGPGKPLALRLPAAAPTPPPGTAHHGPEEPLSRVRPPAC